MKVHSRTSEYENYEFITTKEKGRYRVELVKFLKKGVMLINREYKLAYWVEYGVENDELLSPTSWVNLVIVATNFEVYLEAVESKSVIGVSFSSNLKGFVIEYND